MNSKNQRRNETQRKMKRFESETSKTLKNKKKKIWGEKRSLKSNAMYLRL